MEHKLVHFCGILLSNTSDEEKFVNATFDLFFVENIT
jgi:hypothetical protein